MVSRVGQTCFLPLHSGMRSLRYSLLPWQTPPRASCQPVWASVLVLLLHWLLELAPLAPRLRLLPASWGRTGLAAECSPTACSQQERRFAEPPALGAVLPELFCPDCLSWGRLSRSWPWPQASFEDLCCKKSQLYSLDYNQDV